MVRFSNIEINFEKNEQEEFEKDEDDVLKIDEVEDRYDNIDEKELSRTPGKSIERAVTPERSKKSFVLLDSPNKSQNKSALNKSERSINKSQNKSHNSFAKNSEKFDEDALNDIDKNDNDKTEIKLDDDIVYLNEDIIDYDDEDIQFKNKEKKLLEDDFHIDVDSEEEIKIESPKKVKRPRLPSPINRDKSSIRRRTFDIPMIEKMI